MKLRARAKAYDKKTGKSLCKAEIIVGSDTSTPNEMANRALAELTDVARYKKIDISNASIKIKIDRLAEDE